VKTQSRKSQRLWHQFLIYADNLFAKDVKFLLLLYYFCTGVLIYLHRTLTLIFLSLCLFSNRISIRENVHEKRKFLSWYPFCPNQKLSRVERWQRLKNLSRSKVCRTVRTRFWDLTNSDRFHNLFCENPLYRKKNTWPYLTDISRTVFVQPTTDRSLKNQRSFINDYPFCFRDVS